MSSPPREEGGRSRRRRRRAPAHSNRTGPDHPSFPSQRQQRRPFPVQPSREQPSSPKDENPQPRTPQSPQISTQSSRFLSDPEQQDASNHQRENHICDVDHLSTQPDSQNVERVATEKQRRQKEETEAKEQQRRLELRREHLARRGAERQMNLCFSQSQNGDIVPKERLSDAELRQLDSSLKKCTGFLRKIRSLGFTEVGVAALRSEAAQLNLSRYISEVVAAIVESRLRSSDMEHLVLLCGQMHRRYDDFTSQLISALSNLIVPSSPGGTAKDVSTRKAALRLLVEMFILGMHAEVAPISSVLRHLMKGSKDSSEESWSCLTILASFARFSTRTILPAPSEVPADVPDAIQVELSGRTSWEDDILSRSAKEAILSALQSYFDSDVKRLLKDAGEELRKTSVVLTRSAQVRGTADDTATQSYEAAKQLHDKILSSANTLADCVGKPLLDSSTHRPHPRGASLEITASQEAPHIVISNPFTTSTRSRQSSQESDLLMYAEHPFEEDDQKTFYTVLVPIGPHSPKDQNKSQVSTQRQECKGSSSGKSKTNSDRDQAEGRRAEHTDGRQANKSELPNATSSRSSKESRKKDGDKLVSVEKVMGRLPGIETREEADVFVQDFAASAEGSRNGTKRLAKALYSVSAQKLNLLPAYSRIAASLRWAYADISATVAASLEEDFRFLVAKSDVDEKNLAACIKTAQYIGEYVKFAIVETPTMFELLSLCMKDFSGHRVDVACHLLESCGRYVYLSPSSHLRMGNILETLWRLKSVKNLEARHNALVETAYFAVRLSPGSKAHKKKTRPPIHEYIRHLIYYRLDSSNVRWIHSQLLKLPWDDELEQYVIKKFVKISRARYSTIPYVSTLIAAFQKQKPALGIGIVDALLEAIRAGMEKNDGRESQRRVAEIFLLGEMHKCGVVGEKVIYNILYQLITLGHESSNHSRQRSRGIVGAPSIGVEELHQTNEEQSTPRNMQGTFLSAPDPPADFFRIRLACVLIESCGRVLVASNRRKLEVFWVFLERYMFCKTHQAGQGDRLPLHIGHVVADVFESVLQKPRRAGKEGRFSNRRDEIPFRNGRKDSSSDVLFAQSFPFSRTHSLEEALIAVSRVERSGSDTALISVPVRFVFPSSMPSSLDTVSISSNARLDAPALLSPNPGSGIRGNFKDGFVTTPVGTAEVEGRHRWEARGTSSGRDGALEPRRLAPAPFEETEYPPSGDDLYDDDDTRTGEDTDNEEEEDLLGATGDDDACLEEEGAVEELIDDDDEDDDDDDEDDDDDDDEDDVIFEHRHSRPRTEEEDAFAKELAAFTAAAVQSARASSSRVTKFDRMTIPMSLMTQKLEEEKAAAAAQAASAVDNAASSDEDANSQVSRKKKRSRGESMEFKMLLRKGGKSQLQGIQVPASSSLAVAARESESADAARHEETKRLVLGSSIVLNDDSDDIDDEVQLRAQQHAREKQESLRLQRSADEMELLSTLYRVKPRR